MKASSKEKGHSANVLHNEKHKRQIHGRNAIGKMHEGSKLSIFICSLINTVALPCSSVKINEKCQCIVGASKPKAHHEM